MPTTDTSQKLPFHEARSFARTLGLKTSQEWSQYCAGFLPELPPRPTNLPVCVAKVYEEFTSWYDFLVPPETKNAAARPTKTAVTKTASTAANSDEIMEAWAHQFRRVWGREPSIRALDRGRVRNGRYSIKTSADAPEVLMTPRQLIVATRRLAKRPAFKDPGQG